MASRVLRHPKRAYFVFSLQLSSSTSLSILYQYFFIVLKYLDFLLLSGRKVKNFELIDFGVVLYLPQSVCNKSCTPSGAQVPEMIL